jgi:putative hydrolase of the HAD superfamily
MSFLFDAAEDEVVRPGARRLIEDSKSANYSVGVLTNDLEAFHGPAWVTRISVLELVDVIVDGSVVGMLKPDPAIYTLALDRLGVTANDALFVDDQPVNVAGARAVGIHALHCDVTDPAKTFDEVRKLLGLNP